jgi:hypothetical protein
VRGRGAPVLAYGHHTSDPASGWRATGAKTSRGRTRRWRCRRSPKRMGAAGYRSRGAAVVHAASRRTTSNRLVPVAQPRGSGHFPASPPDVPAILYT